ncbi:MAG: hypothetical protein S0880_32400 [Actinomycetota bacterium]|nr:hypothetical protein [Actinomycetota bacterium]
MTRRTETGKELTDEDLAKIADDFERAEFTPGDIEKIKQTRRRSPRIGSTTAEVFTFRVPSSYKERIKARADADATTESQVIRDALDAYL